MEHFLIIGYNAQKCSEIAELIKSIYPASEVNITTNVTHINAIDMGNVSLIILFIDSTQQDGPPEYPATNNHKTPIVAITGSEADGIKAMTTGADDNVLAHRIGQDLAPVMRKTLARKSYNAAHIPYYLRNTTKDAYEDMLSSMNEIIWSWDPDDLKLVYINNACELLLGYTQQELLSNSDLFIERMHPDDREQYHEAFAQMQQSGKIQEYEFRFQARDGNWKYFKGKGALIIGSGNEKDLFAGITIDITRLVTSDVVIQQKTKELEDILASISDCFYTVDKDWNITFVNKALEDLYGMTSAQLLGKNLWQLFPLLKDTELYHKYNLAAQGQKNVSFEAFSPTLNNWVSTNAYPNPNGLTIFFKDITHRKQMEMKILADRQNLLSIINATSDLIWSVDKDLNILVANQAFWDNITNRYNKTREEVGNVISEEIFGASTVAYWRTIYEQGYKGARFTIVETADTPTGISFSEITLNPIHDLQNNVVGISCFSRDITKTRQHMIQIQEQNQKLKEISWIQSHKVRGPVSTILGLVQLFNMADADDVLNLQVLEGIKETAVCLDEIIREIVTKARSIDKGH